MLLTEIMTTEDTFFYFAYGSNLLQERLHLNNPSAVFYSIAKLNDYALKFDRQNDNSVWQGASATICKEKNEVVWGVIWILSIADIQNLDVQEGVPEFVYKPLTVPVITPSKETIECRTYQLVNMKNVDNRPSPQ